MKMIDIHNHVLPNIDDGSNSYEESLKMLKMAAENDIHKLIVTPHFKENLLENTKDIIVDQVESMKQMIDKHHIDIEIYPGCEIFLTKSTASILNENKLQTLNDSQYILVEIHRLTDSWMMNLKQELYNLSVDGYKIILAHPERYEITHKKPNFIYELVDDGHYMQVNVNSLHTHHPNHKIVKKLLDHHLVHFIASDAHDSIHRPLLLKEGYQYVTKHYGKDYANALFSLNQQKVLLNEPIELRNYKEIKKSLFRF